MLITILLLDFGHFVGSECGEYWLLIFEAFKELPGFDVKERTTIADKEKSIDSAYCDVFTKARIFLDPIHVKANLGAKFGADKAGGI